MIPRGRRGHRDQKEFEEYGTSYTKSLAYVGSSWGGVIQELRAGQVWLEHWGGEGHEMGEVGRGHVIQGFLSHGQDLGVCAIVREAILSCKQGVTWSIWSVLWKASAVEKWIKGAPTEKVEKLRQLSSANGSVDRAEFQIHSFLTQQSEKYRERNVSRHIFQSIFLNVAPPL